MRTGDYIPRLGGTFLTHKDFLKEKRDVVKRFTGYQKSNGLH